MATADFLEDGQWARYYFTNSRLRSYQHPQTPIDEMRFVATRESDSARTLNLHSTGTDGTGAFDLDGTLFQETGQILLMKRYVGGQVWSSAGIMTPMGIVGSWGSIFFGGWMWSVSPQPIILLFKPIESPETLSRDFRGPLESTMLTGRNTTGYGSPAGKPGFERY